MNFFSRNRQQQQHQHQGGYQRPSAEDEALARKQFMAKIQQLELMLKAKQFENFFFQTCAKKCCKFDQENLNEGEQMCLDNCHSKFNRYLTLYKNTNAKEKKE